MRARLTPPATVPRIARVEILWSENSTVPKRTFRSLAEADAALARAFAEDPPPAGGAYDKTAFLIVWSDGKRHEGRADVREVDVETAGASGGILRQHLGHVSRWLRDKSAAATWWTPDERTEHAAWGEDLQRRLDAEPPVGAPRNLTSVPDDTLVPIGQGASLAEVTLLPDPFSAVTALESRFAARRPSVAVWMGHGRTVPRTTNRDLRFATNWITMALAGDMSRLRATTGRPHGAIWDRWARTVESIKRRLGADPGATYPDNQVFWSDQAPHIAHKVSVALHGHAPRNVTASTTADERAQFRITYRGPRGGEYVTHHLAPDYLTALQTAAFSLGFWPEVQSVARLDDGHWKSV